MDNNQMPQVQPVGQPNLQPVQPVQPAQPVGQPDSQSVQVVAPTPEVVTSVPTSAQMSAAAAEALKPKSNVLPIVLGAFLVIFVILSGAFIALYVMKNGEFEDLKASRDLEIEKAVSDAKAEQALQDAEEAKKDTRQFTGPSDYGQLSFDFPKSWSVYIASDASKGGDFTAYLNPIEIEPVSESTVYVLRVMILNKSFEDVISNYQKNLNDGSLSVESVTVGGATANRYTGKIPNTELNGIFVVFKIRDKTAILRTDSMMSEKDFNTVLSTVKFNA